MKKWIVATLFLGLMASCGTSKNSNCNCPKHNWLKKENPSDQRRV